MRFLFALASLAWTAAFLLSLWAEEAELDYLILAFLTALFLKEKE